MSATLLYVQDLDLSHEKKAIAQNINFSVKSGEIFGLIGLNGEGKTTLIKTILGLRKPDSGSVELNKKNDISYLPEKFEPPAFLTGRQFIKFSLKLYGIALSDEKIDEQANNLSFDINFLDRDVAKYSKGMKQKIGLIAAILCKRDLTILDEPMSGLDPKARHEVKNMIEYVRSDGRSIFFSSHILSDVTQLCDRIAILHNKNFVFTGNSEDFLKKGKSIDPEQAFLNLIANDQV